ncbi:MAG TPA: FtsX-like permease family protein [Blastocatellia bacterium]|nr:FtsX-like permease family protein [Blastocatellia bacterium]
MRFIIQMARRELRASWRRLIFFFACIAIGVGGIVAGRSMLQNAHVAIAAEARTLLTADVQVDTGRPWEPDVLGVIDRVSKPLVEARTETIESPTMLRPADSAHEGAMMVELKGIDSGFPLIGDFKLVGGESFSYSLIQNNGAIVSVALLDRLQLNVGDSVNIGVTTFQVRGAIDQEPGRGSGFRIGPRVFIERSAVESAGLTGFGSRARRKILFTVPEDKMSNLVRQLRDQLKNNQINVRSYRESQENLNESFSRAEDYSSLTGLVILVLGGIGISNVTRVFIEQKRKSIAVLKCIGATGRRITVAYLAQVIAMGVAGSLFGIAFGKAVLLLIQLTFADKLPQYMTYGLRVGAALQGLGAGIMISILFSALPLLHIRHIKPNVLLRESATSPRRALDLLRWAVAVLVMLGLLLVVSWQGGGVRVGLFFLGGLVVAAGALYLAATLLIFLLRRTRSLTSFALKQAINSLHRPGNQTRVIVMVVGLGVFVVISVQSLQANFLRELDRGRTGGLPDMFLIDIQTDQRQGVSDLISETTGTPPILVPTVRTRIAAINGKDIDLNEAEQKRERGRLGREYVVTYRPNLESNESIIAGKFWDESSSSEAEVSLEESMRGLSGIDVGGEMTFDVGGRKIVARVTSIRHVDWRNSRTGFLILFRPGVLENAPQMLVGALNGPSGEVERSRFQRALVDRFPNVSVIDVADVVRAVERIINNITLAVSFVASFVLLTGGLILIGSLAMTKFQRIYEVAVLKTLGAKRKVLLKILIAEYGLIGLVSGFIGSLAAVGLSYAISRWVFEIPWGFTPAVNLGGVAATMILVTVVGTLATYDVLARKPLVTLRAQ